MLVFWVLTTFQTPTVNAPERSASTIVRVVTTYLAHRPGVVAGNVAERAGSNVFVVFFTNFLFPVHYYLQHGCNNRDLWKVCNDYGTVVDVFIPNKKSKAGKRFAFVRFIK
ncbi:RNA-directed DNA polymerase, eukaryota, nucleotide-binding alpha-beta plait domain protein, partial [Tanacetum coccineum]